MLIDKIKILLGKSNKSKVNSIKKLVDEILKNDRPDPAKNSHQLNQCLDSMEEQVNRIRDQANDYPNYSIKAETWAEGVALSNHAEALAKFLANKGFITEQERATKLWAQTTLSVCSHYHHLVGPAMIASASISETTGKLDYAKAVYGGVLEDFQSVLEAIELDETEPDEDSLTALQSLNIAAARLLELDSGAGLSSLATETQSRIASILKSPKDPPN